MWRDKSTKTEWPLRPGVSPRPQACYLFQFSLCPHQHIKLKREQFIRAPRASFKTVAALVCQGSTRLPPPVLLPGDPPWDAMCGTDSVCQGSGKTWVGLTPWPIVQIWNDRGRINNRMTQKERQGRGALGTTWRSLGISRRQEGHQVPRKRN